MNNLNVSDDTVATVGCDNIFYPVILTPVTNRLVLTMHEHRAWLVGLEISKEIPTTKNAITLSVCDYYNEQNIVLRLGKPQLKAIKDLLNLIDWLE